MVVGMRISPVSLQYPSGFAGRLYGKRQIAARMQRIGYGAKKLVQMTEIDEHVSGETKIEGTVLRLEEVEDFAFDQFVVTLFSGGDLQHPRREVDAGHFGGEWSEQGPAQSGPATQVDNLQMLTAKAIRDDVEHQVRRGIPKIDHKMIFETFGILVEKRPNVPIRGATGAQAELSAKKMQIVADDRQKAAHKHESRRPDQSPIN